MDGVDVRQYQQQALREKVASVLQKSELFSATIAENIAWGAPDASAEQIRSAAVTAQADGFISSTALGYDTPVAERGMSLSGGQKQRISISRAVLKNAEILIFDDSTSALDLKTEATCTRRCAGRIPRAQSSSSRSGSPPCAARTASSCWKTGASRPAARTASCSPAARSIRTSTARRSERRRAHEHAEDAKDAGKK